MNKIMHRDINLTDIESLLIKSLKPITPRPEYIAYLKQQLLSHKRIGQHGVRPIYYFLLILATSLNLLLFVAISIWTTVTAIGLLGLARRFLRNGQQRRLLSQGRLL